MIDRFQKHIREKFPYLQSKKLLIAISGGIDSVVLTHLLHDLQYNISLVHVNFQLRGAESDGDEAFVKELGKKWNIPVFVKRFDTKKYAQKTKISIQMAARELRYQWFDELLRTHGFDYLLTAHQLDDTIETLFINLNRKSGLDGLTGIPEINGTIVRPLLPFSRSEIEQYADENNLKWREDRTNASVKYERNKIRHLLFPILEQINPDFRTDFYTSLQYLQQSQMLLQDYINWIKTSFWGESGDKIYIVIDKLRETSNYNFLLFHLLHDFGFTDWQSIHELIESQTGKKVLSENHQLLKDRNRLILTKIESENVKKDIIPVENFIQTGNLSYTLQVQKNDKSVFLKEPKVEVLDADSLAFPLYLKRWEAGDYFYPLGMKGKKKLSDFFNDLKISLLEKEKIWLLCDAENRIVWVAGYRIDNRFKVTENTQNILKITKIS